jgi:GNAT superfamily N-acetyltransferase
VRRLPPGWETDLAVLRHTGSVIDDRGDHLVVRSPQNPGFHWGNCLLVTDEQARNDVGRWVEAFESAFADAAWVAIGLPRMPDNEADWLGVGLELEEDEVLTTRHLPKESPLPEGYTMRRLAGSDWDQSLSRSVRDNDRTGESEPRSHLRFAQAQVRSRRALSDRDVAAFFGAFNDGALVAELGIVRCGSTARYQSVGTDEGHRRRGLAGHLLGVAAGWAAAGGCERWVIVTEVTNPAGRLYRSVGFEPDIGNVQAYRKPVH